MRGKSLAGGVGAGASRSPYSTTPALRGGALCVTGCMAPQGEPGSPGPLRGDGARALHHGQGDVACEDGRDCGECEGGERRRGTEEP